MLYDQNCILHYADMFYFKILFFLYNVPMSKTPIKEVSYLYGGLGLHKISLILKTWYIYIVKNSLGQQFLLDWQYNYKGA